IRQLNEAIAKRPNDTGLIEYRNQLEKVRDLLATAQTKEGLEKDVNLAEQAKEYNRELEKAAEFNDRLIADTKRLAEEDLKALDQRKRLENQAEQHVDKNDSSDQDFRDMRLREEADQASAQARLDRE